MGNLTGIRVLSSPSDPIFNLLDSVCNIKLLHNADFSVYTIEFIVGVFILPSTQRLSRIRQLRVPS